MSACNTFPIQLPRKIQNPWKEIFGGFFIHSLKFIKDKYNITMSKRYSGKSFKDSSTAKKPKLSLKQKRKNKKEKSKKS